MSNLVSDHYDYSTDPRCKCRQVHGNADDDGECRHCQRIREQREANDEPSDSAHEQSAEPHEDWHELSRY
jgi:hypothetical protein